MLLAIVILIILLVSLLLFLEKKRSQYEQDHPFVMIVYQNKVQQCNNMRLIDKLKSIRDNVTLDDMNRLRLQNYDFNAAILDLKNFLKSRAAYTPEMHALEDQLRANLPGDGERDTMHYQLLTAYIEACEEALRCRKGFAGLLNLDRLGHLTTFAQHHDEFNWRRQPFSHQEGPFDDMPVERRRRCHIEYKHPRPDAQIVLEESEEDEVNEDFIKLRNNGVMWDRHKFDKPLSTQDLLQQTTSVESY